MEKADQPKHLSFLDSERLAACPPFCIFRATPRIDPSAARSHTGRIGNCMVTGVDKRNSRILEPDEIPAHVDILNLRIEYDERMVFDGLSCRFPQGKITVILGASGGGKSTLLRTIACLQKPDWGDIWVGDQEVTCMPESQCKRFRRRIGMMFQGGALLDSLSIFDNVSLPLHEHTAMSESEIADAVHRQFEAVGLSGVDHLLPGQLSGGMIKRAALARAMILEPEILLCDEPFSGLDPLAVRLIEGLIVETNRRTGVTTLLTSHHMSSTMRMADQVVFLVGAAAVCGPTSEIQQSIDPRIRSFLRASAPEAIEAEGALPASALPGTNKGQTL